MMSLEYDGPVYIRCVRDSVPDVPTVGETAWGKAKIVSDKGNDFALVYEGSVTDLAYKAFEKTEEGLNGKLINEFSIKPFDSDKIKKVATQVKKIVTLESHSIVAGLGSLVAKTAAELPEHAKIVRIGVNDVFTESGPSKAIKEKYVLTVENVLETNRKKQEIK